MKNRFACIGLANAERCFFILNSSFLIILRSFCSASVLQGKQLSVRYYQSDASAYQDAGSIDKGNGFVYMMVVV